MPLCGRVTVRIEMNKKKFEKSFFEVFKMYGKGAFVLVYGAIVICIQLILCSGAAGSGYQLGAGDVVTISIFAGGEKQIGVNLTVSAKGNINFPYIGSVKASGLSVRQLEQKVYLPLSTEYFVDPQVHVQVKEYHSLHFSISGAVKKPGKYIMQSATSIMSLIAEAEGVTSESGKIAYVLRDNVKTESQKGAPEIEKGKSEPIKVNLLKLLDEGDMNHNLQLQSGDSVYIPHAKGLNQATSKVYVSGRVKKPALYEFQPGLTALGLCIMAGGFDKYAAPNRTTIVRLVNGKQEVVKIDLEDVIEGAVEDFFLKPGDRVHVPKSWL